MYGRLIMFYIEGNYTRKSFGRCHGDFLQLSIITIITKRMNACKLRVFSKLDQMWKCFYSRPLSGSSGYDFLGHQGALISPAISFL